MRFSSLYVTLGLALLALSAPLDDDNAGAIQARAGKGKTGGKGGTGGKGTTSGVGTSTSVAAGGHHTTTATTTTTSNSAHGTGTATHTTTSATGSGSSCPNLSSIVGSGGKTGSGNSTSKGGSKTGSKGSKLSKRAGVVHPPGKSDITLFHGTSEKTDADALKSKIDLSVIKHGDLHDVAVSGVTGGFYLTDSLLAAAQFGCRNDQPGPRTRDFVYVLEYAWAGSDMEVKDFKDDDEYKQFLDYDKESHSNPTFDKIMSDNDMLTAPMNNPHSDAGLAPDFWQYAIIKQSAIAKLTYVTTHQVICSAVPPGKELVATWYSASQKKSPSYAQLESLVTTCAGDFDWKTAMA